MAQTYTATFLAVTFANAKAMAAIFNGAGSGRVVRIKRVILLNNQTTAVTGVLTDIELRRSSAQSSGTSVTPAKHDTANETAPAQILFAHGATVTDVSNTTFRKIKWSNDEPAVSAATNDEFECVVAWNTIYDATMGDPDIQPITLREGEGVVVRHTGSSAVGVIDIKIEYTIANT